MTMAAMRRWKKTEKASIWRVFGEGGYGGAGGLGPEELVVAGGGGEKGGDDGEPA